MTVKVYPLDLKTHRESFDLFLIGDLHYGSITCNETLIQKTIETVVENKKTRKTRVILMGDYVDCVPPKDRREDHRIQNKNDVLLVYTELRDMLEPIKDTIVGVLAGNHDEDWYYHTRSDHVNWLCIELGVPYCGYEAYIRFKVAKPNGFAPKNIDVLAWHGAGGGRTAGGAFNKVRNPIESFRTPDIIAMGHMHRLGMLYEEHLTIDEELLDYIENDQYFVLTGGFLKGYYSNEKPRSTYISKKMLPPVTLGAVKLTIQAYHDVSSHDEVKVTFNKVP